MSRTYKIHDVATLRTLVDPLRLAILELLSQPGTATALAEELGVPRTRLYRHLHALNEAGLVKTVETRQVRGTTESVYRAVADSFVPAPELLENVPLDDLIDVVLGVILDTTRAELGARLRSGEVSLNQSGAERRTLSLGRQVARLSPEQANALIAQLEETVADLASDTDDEAEADPYVFQYVFYRSGGVFG